MTVLPIVGRELRVASRRRGTYLGRLSMALAGLLLGGWLFVLPLPTVRDQGIVIFTGLAALAFLCCGLAGIFTTADCLSTEKREGTLGLLFLTDLRGYDIVLGKLSASSLSVSYAVLAIFPILGIPLLMGGVSLAEFVRVIVVAINTLFFSLSTGVFVSSISRDERRAMACCFLLLLFFVAGIPLLAVLLEEWKFKALSEWVYVPGPSYSCVLAFDTVYRKVPNQHFQASVITVHLLAWSFLLLSVWIVRRTWQDKPEGGRSLLRARELRSASDVAYRRELLGSNAYYWLLARHRLQMWSGWFPLVLAGALWAWGLAVAPRDWKDPAAYFMTALALHAIYKVWVGTEVGRRLAQDRASGALELILSTPLSVEAINRGHQLALNRQFLGPFLCVGLLDLAFLLTDRHEGAWVGTFVIGIILLFADYFTMARLGLWMGVCSRSPNRARAAVLVRILVLPVVLYGVMWTSLILLFFMSNQPPAAMESSSFAIGSYLALGLGVDLFFYRWASGKIQETFREAATTRFQRGAKSLARPAHP